MKGHLVNQVALITGAGRGIGEGVAYRYAQEGAKVALVSRGREVLRKVVQRIRKEGGETLSVVADVSVEEEVTRLVRTTVKVFGKIDILVTAAGVLTSRSPIVEVTEEDWETTMAVNLKGSFLCSREVLKEMMKQKSGSIILISSGAGKRPAPYWGPYGVSKFGIEGLMLTMAEEVRNLGIRVNAVNPGGTRTRMRAKAYPDEDPGTLPTPEEISGLFVYLGSEASKKLTGQSIELRDWLVQHPEWK
ncbi:MAG: SDR family oxidoreductase [Candidatus Omnitrophota bacterium]